MARVGSRFWGSARGLLVAALVCSAAVAAGSGRVFGGPPSPGDPGGTAQATLQTAVPVYGPLRVTTTSLPAAARGVTYPSVTLTAAGGEAPYTWSLLAGTLPPGMHLQADGLLSGRPAAAANPILTVQVQDSESPAQDATKVLSLLVTSPGVHVTGSGTASGTGGATEVRLGGAGSSTPETLAAATGGSGTVSVAEYSGNPAPTDPAFSNTGTYFDVALSPGATFTRLLIERCGLGSSPGVVYWWDAAGRRWTRVSDQAFDAARGCLTIVVTATTSPSLADLGGTYLTFGVPVPYNPPAGPAPAPAPAVPTVLAAVGAPGGLLGTADGAFRMAIPAGTIAGGGQLQVAEAPALGTFPPGTVPASAIFVLSGAPLGQAFPATLGYSPAALQGRSPDRLSVYVEGPGGTWSAAPTAVDSVDGTLEVPVSGPETLVVLADLQTFSDVPSGYWAGTAIDQLVAAGAITGYPGGTFRPEGAVTRAEFVKLLDLAVGLAPAPDAVAFADVPPGAWFRPWVAAGLAAGIVQGESATSFAPDQGVTRQEVAVLLARALGLPATAGATLPFGDARAVAPWAAPDVGAAVAAGYIAGFPDGTLRPADPATRAQAASVLALVLLHRAGA